MTLELLARGRDTSVDAVDAHRVLLRIVTVDDLGVAPRLASTFVEAFLRSFDIAALSRHLPEVARVRLADPNVSAAERDRIRRFVDEPW